MSQLLLEIFVAQLPASKTLLKLLKLILLGWPFISDTRSRNVIMQVSFTSLVPQKIVSGTCTSIDTASRGSKKSCSLQSHYFLLACISLCLYIPCSAARTAKQTNSRHSGQSGHTNLQCGLIRFIRFVAPQERWWKSRSPNQVWSRCLLDDLIQTLNIKRRVWFNVSRYEDERKFLLLYYHSGLNVFTVGVWLNSVLHRRKIPFYSNQYALKARALFNAMPRSLRDEFSEELRTLKCLEWERGDERENDRNWTDDFGVHGRWYSKENV